LLEFYESPEFEKKCKKADKNADLSGAEKYKGKSISCIVKMMQKSAAAN